MTDASIGRRQALTYCALPVRVRMESIAHDVPCALEELERYMASRGIQPAGSSLIRYRSVTNGEPFVIEVGWVTHEDIWIDAPFVADVLPEGTYVTWHHDGPFADLTRATSEALVWGERHGAVYDIHEGQAWASWYELYESDPRDGSRGPEGAVAICLKILEPS